MNLGQLPRPVIYLVFLPLPSVCVYTCVYTCVHVYMLVCVHVCVNACENQNDLRYGFSKIVCFDNETVSHTDLGTTN